jgi:hypothetical protein
MTRLFKRCDTFLMLRFFHPVAWYIDWRWHLNQFYPATWCVAAAMIIIGIQMAGDIIAGDWILKLVGAGALGINLFLYQGWLKRFHDAAIWQEDHPGQLAWPHHSFIYYPGQLRFAQMLFSLFLFVTLAPVAFLAKTWPGIVTTSLPGLWLLLLAFGQCFAGVLPPPPHLRREKRERALPVKLATAPAS